MAETDIRNFFLPDLVKKDEELLSNEEVFRNLIDANANLCFSKDMKRILDFFFNSCENAKINDYKIVRLILTDDMEQLMGELAFAIYDQLGDSTLASYFNDICNHLGHELLLKLAFNNFFTAIGEETKILLVLTNFYEHLDNIRPGDVNRLLAFLSKCKKCRLWICGNGEWYNGKHSIYLELYRKFDPIDDSYFKALKSREPIPTVYISYKWKGMSMDTVDALCDLFKQKQIYYKRDREKCRYGDNITDFMDEIREGKFVVVVFSEAYLKSFNCVYELAGILNHPDYMKRIFPIVIDESVRGEDKYEELSNYWENKKNDKELIVHRILTQNKTVLIPLEEKIQLIENYISQLQKLSEVVEALNSYTFKSLKELSFEPLLTKIKQRLYEESRKY